jgi:heme/copper-type cytochrome/quinol oxidase subunit 4
LKYQHKLLILAFVGTLLAIFWQEINSSALNISGPPRYGFVPTADDASYLSPPKNYLESGVWADNSQGVSRYFQRPPGYGAIFGIFHFVLGKYALIGLKIFQICIYFFTIYLLGKTLLILSKSEKWSLIGATIVAVLPIYSGFMYYTLTESLSPFLLLWTIYTFLSSKSLLVLTLPSALLLLVRPQLMIFPLALILFSILKKEKQKILAFSLSFLPLALWMLRSALISGEFQGLHPIYSDTNISLYRPSHAAMTDLFRIWESDGESFHQTIACISSAHDLEELKPCIDAIPEAFRRKTSPIIVEYFQLLHRSDYGNSEEFKKKEIAFIQGVKQTRKELIAASPWTHYLITPVKSAIYLLRKSQLNLNIFQDKFRGNVLMEFVRWISILLINLGMMSALIQLFKKKLNLITVLSAAIIAYFFYLIYFQRMNEERYLTPLLPILLILFILTLKDFFSKIKRIS